MTTGKSCELTSFALLAGTEKNLRCFMASDASFMCQCLSWAVPQPQWLLFSLCPLFPQLSCNSQALLAPLSPELLGVWVSWEEAPGSIPCWLGLSAQGLFPFSSSTKMHFLFNWFLQLIPLKMTHPPQVFLPLQPLWVMPWVCLWSSDVLV